MIRTVLLAGLLGAIAGAGGHWYFMARPTLKLAEEQRDTAKTQLAISNENVIRAREDARSAEASLEALRAQGELRTKTANEALASAQIANRNIDSAIKKILAERTPAGVEPCMSASAQFDLELQRERKK